jgi:hypothetical protein
MMFKHALTMCVAALAGCANQDCALSRPPRDAGVVSNEDAFAFVSPRSLPQSYTGCQVMWDESGSAQYVLRFANGDLSEFATYPAPADTDKKVKVCRYASGKLASATEADCPSYDTVKGGIKTYPVSSQPVVPAARDPRLKSP